MARRDNVKARRRLKKPKKIYTNDRLDFSKSKRPAGLKRPSLSRRHNRFHRAKFTTPDGKIRLNKSYIKEIKITVQHAKSKTFNDWGLQEGMSPQKIRALAKKMDIYLHSQRVSPQTRADILNVWKQYEKASFGYYYSKKPETINKYKSIIKYIEQNTNLLGLKSSFVNEAKEKQAYVVNPLSKKEAMENFMAYEKWYNDVKEHNRLEELRQQKIKESQALMPDLSGIIDAFGGHGGSEESVDDDLPSPESIDISGNWVEYWFYTLGEVDAIIDKMHGWANAIDRYQNDVVRICNCAGYTPAEVMTYVNNGVNPGNPDPNLVWETPNLFISGKPSNTSTPFRQVEYLVDDAGIIHMERKREK